MNIGKAITRMNANLSVLYLYEALILSAALALAQPNSISLLLGGVVSSLGLVLRVWTRGYVLKSREVSVYGPYQYVRHPHQLGTFLILLGLCLASRSGLVTALMLFGSLFLFRVVFKEEEVKSGGHKGALYRDYRLRVPTFIPNLLPYRGPLLENKSFSFGVSMLKGHRRELEAMFALIFVYIMMFGLMRTSQPAVWRVGLSLIVLIYSGISLVRQRQQ